MDSNGFEFTERARTNRAFQVTLILGIITGACASTLLAIIVNPPQTTLIPLSFLILAFIILISVFVLLGFYASLRLQKHVQRFRGYMDRRSLIGILKTIADEESVPNDIREYMEAQYKLIDKPMGLSSKPIAFLEELIEETKEREESEDALVSDFRSQLQDYKAFLESIDSKLIAELQQRIKKSLKDAGTKFSKSFSVSYDEKNETIRISKRIAPKLRITVVELNPVSHIGNRIDEPVDIIAVHFPIMDEDEHRLLEQIVIECLRAIQNTKAYDRQGFTFDLTRGMGYWMLMEERIKKPIIEHVDDAIDQLVDTMSHDESAVLEDPLKKDRPPMDEAVVTDGDS